MSKTIIWIDVFERKAGTECDASVIQSYPFPDIDASMRYQLNLNDFRREVDKIDDYITRECYHTRLHFILNVWHPTNFVKIVYKDWKYNT